MAGPDGFSAPAARNAAPDTDAAANLHAGVGALDPDEAWTKLGARICPRCSLKRERPAGGRRSVVGFFSAGWLGQRSHGQRGNEDNENFSHSALYRAWPVGATART
jgi:hypothetical protein